MASRYFFLILKNPFFVISCYLDIKYINDTYTLKIFVPAIVDKELLNLQKMLDVIIPANLIVNIIINEQIERMRKL